MIKIDNIGINETQCKPSKSTSIDLKTTTGHLRINVA